MTHAIDDHISEVRGLGDFEFWILGVWGTEKPSKLRPVPWQGLRKRREVNTENDYRETTSACGVASRPLCP